MKKLFTVLISILLMLSMMVPVNASLIGEDIPGKISDSEDLFLEVLETYQTETVVKAAEIEAEASGEENETDSSEKELFETEPEAELSEEEAEISEPETTAAETEPTETPDSEAENETSETAASETETTEIEITRPEAEITETETETTETETTELETETTETETSEDETWQPEPETSEEFTEVLHAANEVIIYNFLRNNMGMNIAGACGILANIDCESSFDPHALGDSGTSYGICQWHNTRWDDLKAYCEENGYDDTTLIGQLYFLQYELKKNYGYIYEYLQEVEDSAQGAYDAAYYWCYYFERPYDKENVSVRRGNYAKTEFYSKYANYVMTYTVTYNANGGTGTPPSQTKIHDELLKISSKKPTRTGYTFLGWAKSKTASEAEYAAGSVYKDNADATFYAVWKLIDISSVKLSKTSVEIGINKGIQLTASVSPSEALQKVTWKSSDTGIVSVSSTGVVKGLKRGEAIITATAADGKTTAKCTVKVTFNDILDLNSSFKNAINWAADNSISSGLSNGSFGQANVTTRKEFAVILYKYAGKPSVSGSISFSDCHYVSTSVEYKAILWASKNGIVSGYPDGTFRPDNTVTRQQIMVMFYRYAGKPSVSGRLSFTDVKASKNSDRYRAILWASSLGITQGTSDSTFSPDEGCLKRQVILFLYRYNNLR